ncbi:hypothetical protein JHK85_051228 [Glycine max]|nr:hypothetical protein JHK85_051228 [Glycine max]
MKTLGTLIVVIMIRWLSKSSACMSYNILIEYPSLNELGTIISTPYLTMKFPSETKKSMPSESTK